MKDPSKRTQSTQWDQVCVFLCVFVADLTDFLLRHSSQDGVKLKVFSAGQQVIDGIKLRTVAHVLMHLVDLCSHTEGTIKSVINFYRKQNISN